MNTRSSEQPDRLLRLLRFPPVLLGLLYVVLSYLYVAGYFFRASMAKGPLQGVAASLLSAVLMLGTYAVIAHVVERRKASDLSLPGMGREFGIGLLLGAGLYTACILVLMALGMYRIVGFNTWQVVLPGMAIVIATGVYEELVFRGGVFRLAEEWFAGNGVSQGVLDATLEGPGLLTGGSFGLEASLPAFVLCTATGVILVVMAVRRGHIVPPKWKRRA